MGAISLRNVVKRYGFGPKANAVIHGVSADIADGEFVVIGIKRMISGGEAAQQWNLVMATAMLAMLPPALIVIFMQRWFIKGLVDTEK